MNFGSLFYLLGDDLLDNAGLEHSEVVSLFIVFLTYIGLGF
jgi:hypothetical protein